MGTVACLPLPGVRGLSALSQAAQGWRWGQVEVTAVVSDASSCLHVSRRIVLACATEEPQALPHLTVNRIVSLDRVFMA